MEASGGDAVELAQLGGGEVILGGDQADAVPLLDGVDLLGLPHPRQQGHHVGIVHEAVGEVEAVLQGDGAVEADHRVGIVGILVGVQHPVQIHLELVPLGADGGQFPVQVEGGALGDLVADGGQDGVGHLALVQHVGGDGQPVSGLDGQLGVAAGAGIVDALQHVLPGGIKDVLVGHVAHRHPVDVHRQSVGAAHHQLDHSQQDGQGPQGQEVDHHPGQQPGIAGDAPAQIGDVGGDAGPEAFFPPDGVAVDPDVADAPAEHIDGAEQLPQDGTGPGEGDFGHLMPGRQEGGSQPEGGGPGGAAGADHGVFAGKAQGIQKCAGLAGQGDVAQDGAESLHPVAGPGAEVMPVQQAAALNPRPEGTQLFFCCHGRRGSRLLGLLLLLHFIVNQKSGSPSGGIGPPAGAGRCPGAAAKPG